MKSKSVKASKQPRASEVAPAAPCSEPEPDWKAIATALFHDVEFALGNLKCVGSGILYNSKTGKTRHWKMRFADNLELVPGVKVDRDAMFAMDLPKKERLKFFAERKKREAAEAQNVQTEGPAA